MSPLWLIPGLVWLIGSAAALALLRDTLDETRLLAEELAKQNEIGEAIARLHGSLRTLGGHLRHRR